MRVKDLFNELVTPLRGKNSREQRPWEKAARLAGTIVNPGPDVSRLKAEEVVEALRTQVVVAESHVRRLTKLEVSPKHAELYGDHLADVVVVDRAKWALFAAEAMAELFGIEDATPIEDVPDPTDLNGTVETTAVLTFMSQRTLGQFIPNVSARPMAEEGPGKLLLVAPNVLLNQRAMAVDLQQFSLWIALHEYTHAMQFAAAQWLPQYMRDRIENIIRNFDSENSLLESSRALAEAFRGKDSMIDRLLNPLQREEIAKITALMSVLEGHSEVIMDEVPLSVLPAKRTLRRKFNARRAQTNRVKSTVGRVSGLDQKTVQYSTGTRFVQEVKSKVGLAGFNRVFIGPQYLPTTAELESPADWLDRTEKLLDHEQSLREEASANPDTPPADANSAR